jgi:hypothetical protein
VAWGHWLEFKGEYNPAFAQAMSAILKAQGSHDNPELTSAMIKRQLEIRALGESLPFLTVQNQLGAFQKFLQVKFPSASATAAYPITGTVDQRQLKLEIDLLLSSEHRMTVFQFAGYAEGMKKWKHQAQHMAPFLGWCQILLQQIFPEKDIECYLVFPMEGSCVQFIETLAK